TPCWLFWIVFVPIEPPAKTDTTTTASHPRTAVLRWCALQMAARAVRFRGVASPFAVISLRVANSRRVAQSGISPNRPGCPCPYAFGRERACLLGLHGRAGRGRAPRLRGREQGHLARGRRRADAESDPACAVRRRHRQRRRLPRALDP